LKLAVGADAEAAGGLGVGAQSGADAGHLVGGQAHAGTGPAEEHALVGLATGDALGHPPGNGRPEHLLPGQRAKDGQLMPASLQVSQHGFGHVGLFVGANGESHGT